MIPARDLDAPGIVAVADDVHADARSFIHRLDDEGPRQRVVRRERGARRRPCSRRAAGRRRRKRISPSACASRSRKRARRNACRECAAISSTPWIVPSSPPRPCSALKTTSGLRRRAPRPAPRDRASTSMRVHLVAELCERVGAFAAADQRDLALGGPAAHQHGDALRHAGASRARSGCRRAGSPIRAVMPVLARTRRAHLFAQAFDIGGGGVAGVDQEIRVLLGDHRAAAPDAAAAGCVDELPGLVAGRIGEGRAAGLGADRLARFARCLDLGHAARDRELVAGGAFETARRRRSNPRARRNGDR